MVRSALVAQQVVASLASRTLLAKRYRVLEPIGSGGYASVYRAQDERTGQECAVKEVIDSDNAVREQFRLEGDLLIRAPHDNIPQGYEWFEERGRMYLVMEYIRGKDLEEWLNDSLVSQGRALDEAQVLRWMIQICNALIAMHNQPVPIIHRDIKPANIKITPDGRPVLIDFGLAKRQRAGNPTMTAAQGVSPGFAPPEQYMAKGKTDARTDIYALGATLYACLTGQDPPDAPARLLAQTGARGNGGAMLQSVRKRNPRISEATDRLVTKALELSPLQRQQTARTFQTELKQALMALTGATTASSAAVRAVASGESGKRAAVGKNGAVNGAGVNGNGSYPGKAGARKAVGPAAGGPGAGGETAAYGTLSAMQGSGKGPAAGPDGRTGKQGAAGGARKGAKAPAVIAPGTGKHAAALAEPRTGRQPAAMVEPRLGQLPALDRTGKHGALAERTARQPVVAPDPWTGKQAAAGGLRTGQQPAVSSRASGRQPVVAPRVDYPPATGMMAAPNLGSLALAPGATAASVAVASRGSGVRSGGRERTNGSRPWINLGDEPLRTFGKWMLALACLEVLWGATVLALGGVVIANPGRPFPTFQFWLVWAGVVLLVALIGGPALGRPVYRRGTQTKLRRGLQGTALTIYTLVVHGVAFWGATIFATTQDATLATVAFMLFGINVLVVGILSVVNALS
jgi:predicted Ser/Thr protein kinase